ncbi:MAG: glutathione S-transferase [Solirubrobacteraceae bacterium]|nr:glutathione S-transferase [Solirubrobacteraceae bacterium]
MTSGGWASCNCYKIRLLLAHLARPYERVSVDIFNGETLSDAYARVNPMRTTPVLERGDGRRLADSAAILVYLARGTSYLPEDAFAMADVIRWLIYEQTEVIPMIGGLRFRLLTGRLTADDPEAVRRLTSGAEILTLLDGHLAKHEFFVSERYTIADIALYGYLHVAADAGFIVQPYLHLLDWLQRVARQPGYVNDLVPYGENAAPGAGRSIYD